jgi:hypothetical protein
MDTVEPLFTHQEIFSLGLNPPLGHRGLVRKPGAAAGAPGLVGDWMVDDEN